MNRHLFAIVVGSVLLVASSCGAEPKPTGPSAATGPKTRVVCANAAAAEFVCRLIGPERIAGLPEQVDGFSSIDLAHAGLDSVPRFPRYVAESILALKPDLVVTHDWQNSDTTSILKQQGLDVIVLKSATSWEDIRGTIVLLGAKLGAASAADDLVRQYDARVEKLRTSAEKRARYSALVYSNDGTGGTTAGSETTPDTFLRLAGLKNAAALAGIRGHQPLDFEKLLAIDPDFIVVAERARGEKGSATKDVLESTAVLARLKAVKAKRVILVPSMLMSADSPPLVDAAELVAAEVDRMLEHDKK